MVGDFTIEEAVAADAGADAGFVEEGVETSTPTETAAPSVGDFDSTHFASAVLGPFAVGYDGSGGMGAGSIHAQNASNSQQQTQAQKDRSAAATAQMTTAMQAQQAAYQAAYNNEVSLNIGGEDVEIKQGDLHKGFKAQRQQLEQQIKQTRQAGGTPSAADLRLLERLQEVEEATDPRDGHKMDEEQRDLVQSFADDHPDRVEMIIENRSDLAIRANENLEERLAEAQGATNPRDGHEIDEEQRELVQSFVDDYPDDLDARVNEILGYEGALADKVLGGDVDVITTSDSVRRVSASGAYDDASGVGETVSLTNEFNSLPAMPESSPAAGMEADLNTVSEVEGDIEIAATTQTASPGMGFAW